MPLKHAPLKKFNGIAGLHDSSWQDCPDTGHSIGCYLNLMQGDVVDFSFFTHMPLALSSVEAEVNTGASACMSMSHLLIVKNKIIRRAGEQSLKFLHND